MACTKIREIGKLLEAISWVDSVIGPTDMEKRNMKNNAEFELLFSLLQQADQQAQSILKKIDRREIGITESPPHYAANVQEGESPLWGYDLVSELKEQYLKSIVNMDYLRSVMESHMEYLRDNDDGDNIVVTLW